MDEIIAGMWLPYRTPKSRCTISLEVPADPVCFLGDQPNAGSLRWYDRPALEAWLLDHDSDPDTRALMGYDRTDAARFRAVYALPPPSDLMNDPTLRGHIAAALERRRMMPHVDALKIRRSAIHALSTLTHQQDVPFFTPPSLGMPFAKIVRLSTVLIIAVMRFYFDDTFTSVEVSDMGAISVFFGNFTERPAAEWQLSVESAYVALHRTV
jgi:hypothetical protein